MEPGNTKRPLLVWKHWELLSDRLSSCKVNFVGQINYLLHHFYFYNNFAIYYNIVCYAMYDYDIYLSTVYSYTLHTSHYLSLSHLLLCVLSFPQSFLTKNICKCCIFVSRLECERWVAVGPRHLGSLAMFSRWAQSSSELSPAGSRERGDGQHGGSPGWASPRLSDWLCPHLQLIPEGQQEL